MSNYSKVRLSDELVNLTNSDIYIYEECTGIIKKIKPSNTTLPNTPEKNTDKNRTHYICEPRRLEEIRQSDRRLSDIAVVCSKHMGRDNTLITKLVWGNDPHIEVRLHAAAVDAYGY